MSEDPILAPFTPLSVGMCRKTNFTIWTLTRGVSGINVQMAQMLNQYVYTKNNPVKFSDSSGMISDSRPCGAQIDKCVDETRNTPAGQCTGTQYRLYWGGESGVSHCKQGIFTEKCLILDLNEAIANCREYGPLPDSCTKGMLDCIYTDPKIR